MTLGEEDDVVMLSDRNASRHVQSMVRQTKLAIHILGNHNISSHPDQIVSPARGIGSDNVGFSAPQSMAAEEYRLQREPPKVLHREQAHAGHQSNGHEHNTVLGARRAI